MSKKIYLSPSSQPNNIYAGLDTNEQEVCRSIARDLSVDLIRCGFEVKCGDHGTMYDRVKESNDWKADLHLPIHTNAFNGKVSGTRLMAYNLTGLGYKVCEAIMEPLDAITPGTSSNITAQPKLYEIQAAYAPTAYVEVDFHDVPAVAKWLVSNTQAIAEAICKGVCKYYGVDFVPAGEDHSPSPEPTTPTVPTIYGLPTVKSGSRGDAAKIVQGALISQGHSCGSSGIDGVFGTASVAALKQYQAKKGIMADGIVGPATWGYILGA